MRTLHHFNPNSDIASCGFVAAPWNTHRVGVGVVPFTTYPKERFMSLRIVRNMFVALVALATALPFVAAPAHAAPADSQTRAQVQTNDNDVEVKIFNGSLTAEDGFLVFRNDTGKATEKYPLSFIAPDNRTYPIDASIKGDTATLVPSKNAARSTTTDARVLAKSNVADRGGYKSKHERDDAALNRLNSEMAAGGTISALIGTAVGAVVGGAVGCLVGMVATPFGCFFAGLPIGATIGGVIGTVAIGGPAAVVSIVRYFNTINAPFKNVKSRN
ncbi:hypothetical protein [Gordonia zhaorongruii]|uniref:hypothetical protein n=1 Tax=Gordonia zhaorongruii TaxID=2597659 RepID=UPI001F3BEE96|nr:hypothetical protein [Gordonia zhaorongruii]